MFHARGKGVKVPRFVTATADEGAFQGAQPLCEKVEGLECLFARDGPGHTQFRDSLDLRRAPFGFLLRSFLGVPHRKIESLDGHLDERVLQYGSSRGRRSVSFFFLLVRLSCFLIFFS